MNDRSNLQLILTSFPSPPPPLFLYFSPPAIICLVHNINGGKIRRREGIGGELNQSTRRRNTLLMIHGPRHLFIENTVGEHFVPLNEDFLFLSSSLQKMHNRDLFID
jgi:hypothetical protein